MFSSSKKIQASVFSVAGAPSFGSCCTNPVKGTTRPYTASLRVPSRVTRSVIRETRTDTRPSGVRVMTDAVAALSVPTRDALVWANSGGAASTRHSRAVLNR